MSFTSDFTDNPILRRELRARLRPRALRGNQSLLYGVYALCGIIVYCYVRGLNLMWHGPKSDARDLFQLLVWGLLVLIALIAPALSATAISQEREQQTWEILAVTRIEARQVIIGKWIGRQLLIGLALIIVLPFLVGSAARAELPASAVLYFLIYLLLATNFFTALGLLCSFRAKRTPTATAFALVSTALLTIGTPIVNEIVKNFGLWSQPYDNPAHVESPVMWINPFYAMSIGSDIWQNTGNPVLNGDQNTVLWVCVVAMLGFTISTAIWLTRRFRDQDGGYDLQPKRSTRKNKGRRSGEELT